MIEKRSVYNVVKKIPPVTKDKVERENKEHTHRRRQTRQVTETKQSTKSVSNFDETLRFVYPDPQVGILIWKREKRETFGR